MKVRIHATTSSERHEDVPIGVFSGGVVIDGDDLIDLMSNDPILTRRSNGCWVGPNESPQFERIFVQGIAE
jgi:hypothetical protein